MVPIVNQSNFFKPPPKLRTICGIPLTPIISKYTLGVDEKGNQYVTYDTGYRPAGGVHSVQVYSEGVLVTVWYSWLAGIKTSTPWQQYHNTTTLQYQSLRWDTSTFMLWYQQHVVLTRVDTVLTAIPLCSEYQSVTLKFWIMWPWPCPVPCYLTLLTHLVHMPCNYTTKDLDMWLCGLWLSCLPISEK